MKSESLVGCGIGFRLEHVAAIFEQLPEVPWFEVLIDNYMAENSSVRVIDQLVEHYPISFHGVGLSIGSIAPIDYRYLNKLKLLKERWQPKQISDHFAWTGDERHQFHELLPLTATLETVHYLTERINCVQDYLGEQILLENASTYVKAPAEMKEWEFINEVCTASGCALLLDINNIHVNAFNHGFKVEDYINGINLSHVKEIHLAGHEDFGDYLFDSHSRPVSNEVWESYRRVIEVIPQIPTLVEWDNELPELEVLVNEAEKAKRISQSVLEANQTTGSYQNSISNTKTLKAELLSI